MQTTFETSFCLPAEIRCGRQGTFPHQSGEFKAVISELSRQGLEHAGGRVACGVGPTDCGSMGN